jgi:hypothetical protein
MKTVEVSIGNRLYRETASGRVQMRMPWNSWSMRYDWTDVKTEKTRLKVLALVATKQGAQS